MDRARRRQLRDLNERAWKDEKDVFVVNSRLESSFKRNSAFIKRLRSAISPATLTTFLSEIRSLSLLKYLTEIIPACYDGLCKLKWPGEVEAGVEIVSALHQRFGPEAFTMQLGWHLGHGMATPDKSYRKTLSAEAREKEEKERLPRQRVLLRVVTELWLVGILRTLDDTARPDEGKGVAGKVAEAKLRALAKGGSSEPFPLEVLKDLLGHDREHANLPLLVTFVKTFHWDILGTKASASDTRKAVGEDHVPKTPNGHDDQEAPDSSDDPPFTPPELQEKFKKALQRYLDDVQGHLVRNQKAIVSQSRRNAEAYVKSGEVFEDRQTNFEKQVKSQERLVANAQVIADAIGAEMPDIKGGDDAAAALNGGIGLVKTGDYLRGLGDGAGIWEDEDERRFYENLVDLKSKVPAILFEDVKKKKPDGDEQVGKRIAESTEAPKAAETAADDQSTAIVNKATSAQVDALLVRLPDLNNKDAVDQMAIEFCYMNSKASRNRLVKALTDVPKGRTDLFPYWGRLIATLGRYMADIPKALVDYLDDEFRSLQRRKGKDFLGQVRLGNIRYLAELTKFGIVPEHVVFHCLKVGLDDFSRVNIEIICDLLENCGRYLLRNPETQPRMASFMETLQRKKSVQHIGQAEKMLVENAVYYVDPPKRPAIQQKERSPVQQFIHKLLYGDMDKKNVHREIVDQIRRLHWEESDVVAALHKVFTKPGKVKYGNIHCLAQLLAALWRYHSAFVVGVIDALLESVMRGLERNDFNHNQRRIAEIKYVGELYAYRMIEHPVVFDVMYRIILCRPMPPDWPADAWRGGGLGRGPCHFLDMPNDLFRIRLIATMLDTCATFFTRGASGKKLDYFLSFFQYHIWTKQPLPMDIEFLVQDLYALTRPKWKLASNVDEALKVFQLAAEHDQATSGLHKVVEQEADEGPRTSSSDDDNAGEEEVDDNSSLDQAETEEAEPSISPRGNESEEEEAIVVTRHEEQIDPEAEADFEREYAKMMAENLEPRKFERKPQFDLPLPVRSKNRDAGVANGGADSPSGSGGTMAFSLLTKKGNRQQTKTVELPSDSHFAIAMKNQQQAEKEQQQRIKELVLNLDLQQNEDQDGEHQSVLFASAPNTTHSLNCSAGYEKPTHHHRNRPDNKAGSRKGAQQGRKLQLGDFDWK